MKENHSSLKDILSKNTHLLPLNFNSIVLILFIHLIFNTPAGAQTWYEINKSIANQEHIDDNLDLGRSVSIDGDYAVVGMPGFQNNTGCAYVLKINSGNWEKIAHLTASDATPEYQFGYSVSISENTIVIGATNSTGVIKNSGAVYVYTKPENGWTDSFETVKLYANDGIEYQSFGSSVKISNENIVVGAYKDNDNGYESGAAYVFSKPINGWSNATQTAKLTASDSESGDFFGFSVDIFENNIIVGAHKDKHSGISSGSAYLFTKPENGWTDITETAKLTSSNAASSDNFGYSVSIYGENILVGANKPNKSGAAYFYTKPESGWVSMNEDAMLTPIDGSIDDNFGYSTSIYKDYFIVGAYGDDENGYSAGAAYIYKKSNDGWSSTSSVEKIIASDGSTYDYFGGALCISGDYIIIGAVGDDDEKDRSGSIYIFAPLIATNQVVEISDKSAILRGSVYSKGTSYNVGFEYGLTNDYGTNTTALESPISAYTSATSEITDLIPNTTYHYRAVLDNNGVNIYGSDMSFTTKKSATISGLQAEGKVYDGTDIAIVNGTPILNGIEDGDDVTLKEGVNKYDSDNVGIRKIVTGYTLIGKDAIDYSLSQPDNLTGEITPKAITIRAKDNQSKIFGQSDPILTYEENDGLVTGDIITGNLSREIGENVGSYEILIGDLSAGNNYAITYIGNTFTITAKDITITVDENQSKLYGEKDPFYTFTSNDSNATFTGELVRESGEEIGKYPILRGSLNADSNWHISEFTGSDFHIIARSDATLKAIYIDESLIDNFSSEVTDYYINLPVETYNLPIITATTNDEYALIDIVQTNDISVPAKVRVTAQDLETSITYNVYFSISNNLKQNKGIISNVQPNPTNGKTLIKVSEYNENTQCFITDVSGRIVYKTLITQHETLVDLSKFDSGIYIITITINHKKYQKKVVKN